jgi:hypothetical protein
LQVFPVAAAHLRADCQQRVLVLGYCVEFSAPNPLGKGHKINSSCSVLFLNLLCLCACERLSPVIPTADRHIEVLFGDFDRINWIGQREMLGVSVDFAVSAV